LADKANPENQKREKMAQRRKTNASSASKSMIDSVSRSSPDKKGGIGDVKKTWWSQYRDEVHLNGN
jgi:hypothetical protein